MGTAKVDFKKTLETYRASQHEFQVIEVPSMQYLMIDGHGDPNTTPEFTAAIETLYLLAYAMKFASKADGRDYVVPPLEGLWWADDQEVFTSKRDQSKWDWTLMLMVPEWIGADVFADAVARVAAKPSPPAALDRVRFESLAEGTCVQTIHVGPFADEGGVLETMHREFIPAEGLAMSGKHHEIYLNDFRRVAPEKMRTILRQPVRVV